MRVPGLGPTGCGKTGLATSFLLQAIDRGHRGYFVLFSELVSQLYASHPEGTRDHSTSKMLRKYAAYDCLLIDRVPWAPTCGNGWGYVEMEPTQVGHFFTLMQQRMDAKTTLITSNLGFAEWGKFLQNDHLTAALLDRRSSNSHVINMKRCKSLRQPLDKDDGQSAS